MNFEQAMAEYARLRQGYDSRQISGEEFGRRVQAFQVRDASGTYWAIDGNTGGWLRYDGSNWVPGTPPVPQARQPASSAATTRRRRRPPGNSRRATAAARRLRPAAPGGFGAAGAGRLRGRGVASAARSRGWPPQPAAKRRRSRALLIGCGVLVVLLLCVVSPVQSSPRARGWRVRQHHRTDRGRDRQVDHDDKRPDEKATDFTVNSQMYITYTARRAKKGETVDLKLYRNGAPVDLTGGTTTFEKDATYYGYYNYTPSVKGTYKAELYYNGESSPSQTLIFTVK